MRRVGQAGGSVTRRAVGLLAIHETERWLWQHLCQQAGYRVLLCPDAADPTLCPDAWIMAPPAGLHPQRGWLALLPVTAPTLIITPWVADTIRLVHGLHESLIVAHPTRVRHHVSASITMVLHLRRGALVVT